ncbi:MAG: hypothetical protein WB562_04350 [Candidatus Sulfotelmatobacter sp.]
MRAGLKLTGLLAAGALCLPVLSRADTQATHHVRKTRKQQLPPLPSGPQGPVQQVPLDSITPVAPQVSYENEQLTIVAPNSTLGDILRAVRKHTAAEIEVPASATERVVIHLGPAPAREVMAELLNGSRFNYVLLGSPTDANLLTRVVLVAKTGTDTVPSSEPQPGVNQASNVLGAADAAPDATDAEATDDTAAADENTDQGTADAEQPAAPAEQPGVKTPQQLLQEMQQRQLIMQQQQQTGQPVQPGQIPGYPPGVPMPQPPQQNQ